MASTCRRSSFADARERRGELQMRDMFVGKAEGPFVEFKSRGRDRVQRDREGSTAA